MKEAAFYEQLNEGIVKCKLCPHHCTICQKERGNCGVRENRDGRLISLVYNRLASHAFDPIEKKPLFHYFPGSLAFSVSTVGCNFSCSFCQNSGLSQSPKPKNEIFGEIVAPEIIIKMAGQAKIISYTYSEPTIAFEYWKETMTLAKQKGLLNTFVTNGFINPEPFKQLAPLLGAANIDLKSFSEEFYERIAGGRLKPVLDSIRLYHQLGVWIEITTLVIPGKNDSDEELKQIAEFIVSVDKAIPWHISRFYPNFKIQDTPATPVETLLKAAQIGKDAGLNNVYIGNVQGLEKFQDTVCAHCGAVLIKRSGYSTQVLLKEGKCPVCEEKFEGVLQV